MARQKFSEWKERLLSTMREDNVECDFDEELAANYWREGFSAQEFYREMISSPHTPDDGDAFNPRYDM